MNKTILVVEDDPDLLDLLRDLLELQSCVVLSSSSGRGALELWEKNSSQIDLLLTDLTLPDQMSGVALAKILQAQNPKLPVIYTSGYAPEMAAIKFDVPAGATFLQKPFYADVLWQTVQSSFVA